MAMASKRMMSKIESVKKLVIYNRQKQIFIS